MMQLMISAIRVKENILADERYKFLFSVEEVNKLVLAGVPFRDAYQQVGEQIEKGNFTHTLQVKHTHEGSIGNLCNDQIKTMMEAVLAKFPFEQVRKAIHELLK